MFGDPLGGSLGNSLARFSSNLLTRFVVGDAIPAGAFTGPAGRTYFDSGGVLQTAGLNVLRGAPGSLAYFGTTPVWYLEGARTMYFANSGAPATQTSPSLATGTYTLWMVGTGSIAVAGTTATITGGGTATAGTPVTFVVTVAGTVTFTVTGSPTRAQCELGGFATSYFATTAVPATRAADVLALPISFPEQELTAYAKWIDQGSQASSSGNFGIGDLTTRPSVVAYHNAVTSVSSAFHNGTAQQNGGTLASSIVAGDTVEARLTLTRGGVLQRGHSRNGGAESVLAVTPGQALGTGWGGSVLLVNKYSLSGTDGFAGFQKIVVAAGIRTLGEMRGY